MRYVITRDQLRESTNPFVKELLKRDFFIEKYDYRDPLHQIKLDWPRKDPRPGLLIDGKEYQADTDIDSTMVELYGDRASHVGRAYSQDFVAHPGYLVQMSLKRLAFSPHQGMPGYELTTKIVANLFKEEEPCLEALGEGFPMGKADDPAELDFMIPGSIKIYSVLDPTTNEYRIDRIETSNRLLHKICMQEVTACEKHLSDPGIIEDELYFSFQNSINQEKRNLMDLIERIPAIGCQRVITEGVETYLEILHELNKSLFAEDDDSVEKAAMWQRLLDRKMNQILDAVKQHLVELVWLNVLNVPTMNAAVLSEEFKSALSRLETKASQIFINRAISNIAEHGAKIPNKSEKKKVSNDLVNDLMQSSNEFFGGNDFSQNRKTQFLANFSNKIIEKESDLNIPRTLWRRFLQYAADKLRSLFQAREPIAADGGVAPKNSPRFFTTKSYRLAEEACKTAKTVLTHTHQPS